MSQNNKYSENSYQHLYVVGVGRSGTSLIQSMLASHPWISFPPETSFIRRLIASGVLRQHLLSGMDDVHTLLDVDELFARTKIDVKKFISILSSEGAQTPRDIYRTYLGVAAIKDGFRITADKDPRMVEWLPLLDKVLPGCNVVHMLRDPRDVLVSKKKAAWSKRGSTFRHLFAYRVQLQLGRRGGAEFFSGRYHEIVYEDLIQKPESTLRELCKTLSIPYSDVMLNFSHTAKMLVAEDELQWKKSTMGPLLMENAGKWRKSLSTLEVALTEMICSELFVERKYVCSKAIGRLKFTQRFYVYAMFAVVFVVTPIFCRYQNWRARKSRRFA